MYSLINQYAPALVDLIAAVTDYEWLLQNAALIGTPDYRTKYRSYWGMNVARLSPTFHTTYFSALTDAINQAPMLRNVVQTLYDASTRRDGRKSIQFSFATKLLHMANPRLPIYDSLIADFYFFQIPTDRQQQIDSLVTFYEFLIREYARVLKDGLLDPSIREVRSRLAPTCCTDERIIDLLIWAFVNRLRNGALHREEFAYR